MSWLCLLVFACSFAVVGYAEPNKTDHVDNRKADQKVSQRTSQGTSRGTSQKGKQLGAKHDNKQKKNLKNNRGEKPQHATDKQFKTSKKNTHQRGDSLDTADVSDILIAAGITYLDARGFAEGAHATGYKPLPPGIQKNLLRGKPLPPGIAKKMVPGSMLDKLPKHQGYRWAVAGRDLVLIHVATHVVSDILHDVFK